MADGELAQGAGAQQNASGLRRMLLLEDRLHGIAHDVEQGLDQLFMVGQQLGDARVVVALEGQLALGFRLDQAAHALEDLVDVGRHQLRQLVGAEHAVHQVTQAVGLLDDHVGVVLEARLRQLAGQQLGGTADAAQRVLDLVGQAAHQQAGGLLLGQLRFLLADAQQAVARVQLEQQQEAAQAGNRRGGVVDRDVLAAGRHQLRFALGERVAAGHRLAQGGEAVGRLVAQFADEQALAALAADAEQHLGGRVHVFQAQFGIQQNDRGGEIVEQQALQRVVGHGKHALLWMHGFCKKRASTPWCTGRPATAAFLCTPPVMPALAWGTCRPGRRPLGQGLQRCASGALRRLRRGGSGGGRPCRALRAARCR
ncbi:hypothetical protein D3C81_1286800 [compost metagenome]